MLFDHVNLRVTDRPGAEAIYRRLLGVLGFEQTASGHVHAEWGDFALAGATAEKPPTRRLHIGFRAPSREAVDEFWRAGLDAGLRDDGEPGPRPEYSRDYYGGFLLDADDNSIEAVHHGEMPEGRCVDHVWMRVADLARSREFYEAAARFAGYESRPREDRVHFVGPQRGSFSILPGEPTCEAHLAFPAAETATVDAFHAALTDEGHRDNGRPGVRPEYTPVYYGAFVLDPDGNNIEMVHRS